MNDTARILEQMGRMQRHLAELKASLTHQLTKETLPEDRFDLFVCRARNEHYGIPIHLVSEVLPMCSLTDYPQAPKWFSGMLNLRGQLIPVLDVSARIDQQKGLVEPSDFIVVVAVEGKQYGLVFKEVFRVMTADGAAVQPPMRDVPEALYILGIVESESTPVFLLSLSCLLGTSEIPEDAR